MAHRRHWYGRLAVVAVVAGVGVFVGMRQRQGREREFEERAAARGLTSEQYRYWLGQLDTVTGKAHLNGQDYAEKASLLMELREFEAARQAFTEGLTPGKGLNQPLASFLVRKADERGQHDLAAAMAKELGERFPNNPEARAEYPRFLFETKSDRHRDPVRAVSLIREIRRPYQPRDGLFLLLIRAVRAAGGDVEQEYQAEIARAEGYHGASLKSLDVAMGEARDGEHARLAGVLVGIMNSDLRRIRAAREQFGLENRSASGPAE